RRWRPRALRAPTRPRARADVVPYSLSPRGQSYILPATLDYLLNETAGFAFVNSLRWPNGKPTCPRCNSKFVKGVNTKNPRQLFRCVDCSYMFNCFSATLFHSAKIRIHKHLQFFIMQNAMGADLRMPDVCMVLGCNIISARRLRDQTANHVPQEKFTLIDKRLTSRLMLDNKLEMPLEDGFATYCNSKGILVIEDHFTEFVRTVCRTIVR
ncbi:MAG: IS1595 family transposase, partial [Verrucomicrobiaceae bacterium]